MANHHMCHVNAVVRSYNRRAGADPTPQAPWSERRLTLLRRLAPAEWGGGGRRVDYAPKGPHRMADVRDLQRLIDEGLVVLSGKTRARPCRRMLGGGRQSKALQITPAGLALVAPPPAVRVPEPYAKRRAAVAALRTALRDQTRSRLFSAERQTPYYADLTDSGC